jgi:hypothetical protein
MTLGLRPGEMREGEGLIPGEEGARQSKQQYQGSVVCSYAESEKEQGVTATIAE